MKKFCSSLKELATNVIGFERKKNVTVNKKRSKIIPRCDGMLHLWKKILKKFAKDKNYRKVRDYYHFTGKYRSAAHSIFNLRFNVPNEMPIFFQNF